MLLISVLGIAVVCQLSVTGSAGAATSAATAKADAGAVQPNAANELDCNGWTTAYKTVRPLAGMDCTDPIKVVDGKGERFTDNGWYVGHDEPSVKFLSSQPGSGNTMTYIMKLSRDPAALPTANGSVTDYGQLSPAPWFGLPICDPHSYPQNPCTPDSDTNSGSISNPNDAGSAFMELQFYPPGFTPVNIDGVSCSATKWCAAINIDSFECTFGFATCNNNCIEPVNFAFIQTNGVPTGPPSPQLTDVSTFTPDAQTLEFNPGDELVVSITDPPQGLTVVIQDLTTHRFGFMTASAANGFMNTNIADCTGVPFTFHAEYSTAQIQNQVPWAALEGGVLMEQEIGHGEVCNSVTNQDSFDVNYPGGQSYDDPNVYDTCVGGSEGPSAVGEGPCNATTGVCQNSTTQGPSGPVACPTNNELSGALCEFADGFCFQQGTRTAIVNGVPTTEVSRANECFQDRFQNGDLDYDGQSYQPDWPNGSPNYPTSFQYIGPFTVHGNTYPQVQFETDAAGSENLCNTGTGAGCTAPPISANFYPFWSLGPNLSVGPFSSVGSLFPYGFDRGCVWNFGNTQPDTVQAFGKDAQYGVPDVARYGGTLTSAPIPNPEFNSSCRF